MNRIWVKRFGLGIFVAVFAAIVTPAGARAACTSPPADITQNGVTDVVDVQCSIVTALYTLGGSVGDAPACLGPDPEVADVNCDGQADVVDVQLVISVALKSPFSTEIDLDQDGCVDTCEGALFCADQANGAPCSDGDICTVADACFEGSCLAGLPDPCDDDNSCTTGTCVAGKGCEYTPTGDAVASNCCTTHSGGGCQVAACSDCVCQQNPLCCLPLIGNWNAQCVQLAQSATCAAQCKCAGAPCDDANVCTTGTTCAAGVCGGGISQTCNDSNVCTDDTCDPQLGCVYTPANGKSCDQGTGCTAQAACADGVCKSPTKNCDDGNPCTQDSCPATADVCVFVADPTLCDDGNDCTLDTCAPATGCTHTAQGDAVASNCCASHLGPGCNNAVCQSCVCAANFACCAPTVGAWSNQCAQIALSGQCAAQCKCTAEACDDGDACTTGSTCAQGVCTGGADADCDDDNPCTTDECDPTIGCIHTPQTGATCDPSAPCVPEGVCSAGACLPGPVDCDDGIACTTDSCSPLIGGCAHVPQNAACNDNNVCTADTCTNTGCANTPTGDKVPSDCCSTHSAAGCTNDICEDCVCALNPFCCAPFLGTWNAQCAQLAASGQCASTCACGPSIGVCNDGNACTISDACSQGTCTGSGALLCNDNNPCTTDTCDPAVGCVFTPQTGTACNPNQPCISTGTCNAGQCVPGPVNCDDGIACTTDSCPPTGGGCLHVPQNAACNDNNVCTADTCTATGCANTPTGDKVPSDCCSTHSAAGCTNDICEDCVCALNPLCCAPFLGTWNAQCAQLAASGQCASTCACGPSIGVCNDGNACTISDACSQGTCTGSGALLCNDNNPCTTDTCDPAVGCVFTPQTGTACSDGLPCTVGDACAAGACQPGTNTCNDNKPCTIDSCTASGACTHTPSAALCNDNNVCTIDTCSSSTGACIYAPTGFAVQSNCCATKSSAGCNNSPCQACVCAAQPQCCAPLIGSWSQSCVQLATTGSCMADCKCTASACDDNNACTSGTLCNATGQCAGGTAVTCNDNNPCTLDTCSQTQGCVFTPANGATCSDGKACTVGDVCSGGTCVPGTNACADGIACTDDVCTSSGCMFTPNAAKCNDNNSCTTDVCTLSAGCTHTPTGDKVVSNCCSAHPATAGCNFGTCESCVCGQMPQCCVPTPFGTGWTAQCAAFAATGACSATCQCTAKTCNDGDPCTTGDICVTGQCEGQDALNCADNNPCTVDVCDDVLGCQHLLEPAASSCCGQCGGAAATCACDAECLAVGDCCNDYCGLCGGCP